MIDYYEYLLKISWPALSGLFVIYVFLGIRVFQVLKKAVQAGMDFTKWFRVTLRVVVTVMVLAIYTYMFAKSYGDWFYRPTISRGIVESIATQEGVSDTDYFLSVIYGEEIITVHIDQNISRHLQKGDLIEFSYLPLKKEVFKCTIITRQAEDII